MAMLRGYGIHVLKATCALWLGATLVIGATALAGTAAAQDYPTRPIRLIVPYSAGGASDVMARYLGQKLGDRLGQPVVVENQAGAAGTPAYVSVAKAAPDGYTLIYATSSLAINAALKPKLGYDPVRDFTPITNVLSVNNVLVVPSSSPLQSVADLVAAAKRRPGELNFVTLGPGSTPHLSAELFMAAAGITAQPVAYKLTTQAYTDLFENRVQFWIASMPSTLPHVHAGKIRALAVTSTQRSAAYPQVPTLIESGVNADTTFWQGLFAPAGTSPAVVATLNAAVRAVLAEQETRDWYAKLGADLGATTPDELAAMLRADLGKWAATAKRIGLVEN